MLEKSNDFSGCPSNIKIHIQKCETENSEADWIASKIENMIGGTRSFSFESRMSDGTAKQGTESFSDFAILCRTTHMFEPIIVALCNHGIAYQVISAEPFFNMEPVKTAIASFKKIYYRKCKGQSPAHSRIQKMIMEKQPVSNILISLLEGEDISEQDISKLKTLTSDIAYGYDNFFKSIALRRSIDDYNEKVEAVTLMTLHAAKGLEFRTVFIPGCEQGIIPFELFGRKSGEELEEEKRLFYVGITRTKENLFLSYAGKRTFNGRLLLQRKSVFVDKIKDELLNFEIWPPKKRPGASQLDLF